MASEPHGTGYSEKNLKRQRELDDAAAKAEAAYARAKEQAERDAHAAAGAAADATEAQRAFDSLSQQQRDRATGAAEREAMFEAREAEYEAKHAAARARRDERQRLHDEAHARRHEGGAEGARRDTRDHQSMLSRLRQDERTADLQFEASLKSMERLGASRAELMSRRRDAAGLTVRGAGADADNATGALDYATSKAEYAGGSAGNLTAHEHSVNAARLAESSRDPIRSASDRASDAAAAKAATAQSLSLVARAASYARRSVTRSARALRQLGRQGSPGLRRAAAARIKAAESAVRKAEKAIAKAARMAKYGTATQAAEATEAARVAQADANRLTKEAADATKAAVDSAKGGGAGELPPDAPPVQFEDPTRPEIEIDVDVAIHCSGECKCGPDSCPPGHSCDADSCRWKRNDASIGAGGGGKIPTDAAAGSGGGGGGGPPPPPRETPTSGHTYAPNPTPQVPADSAKPDPVLPPAPPPAGGSGGPVQPSDASPPPTEGGKPEQSPKEPPQSPPSPEAPPQKPEMKSPGPLKDREPTDAELADVLEALLKELAEMGTSLPELMDQQRWVLDSLREGSLRGHGANRKQLDEARAMLRRIWKSERRIEHVGREKEWMESTRWWNAVLSDPDRRAAHERERRGYRYRWARNTLEQSFNMLEAKADYASWLKGNESFYLGAEFEVKLGLTAYALDRMEFGEDALLNGRRQSAEEAAKEDRRFAESPEYNRVRIRKVLDRNSFQNALYRIPTDHFPVRATSESGEPVRSIDGLRAIYGGLKENSPPLVYSLLGGPDASNAEQGTRFGVFFALAVVSILTGGTVMVAAQKAMGMTTGTLVASGGMAFVEHNITYFHGWLWGDDISFDSWWKSSLMATGLGVAAGGIGAGLVRANGKPVGAAGAKPAVEPPSGGGVRPAGSKASSGAIEVAEGGASPGAAGKGGSGARAPMDASPSEASGTVSVQASVQPMEGAATRVGAVARPGDAADTNALLDILANRPGDVRPFRPLTEAAFEGGEIGVAPRSVTELAPRTQQQIAEGLKKVGAETKFLPEGSAENVTKLSTRLRPADAEIAASGYEHVMETGGRFITRDKRMARGLIYDLLFPRDRIVSVGKWDPKTLAILLSLGGLGAAADSSQEVVTPGHQ